MNEIERIVKEFIPRMDAHIIPDLVKELEKYCQSKANENFNKGSHIGFLVGYVVGIKKKTKEAKDGN